MFDIGFGELVVVFVVALVVLGPERLPVVVKTVMKWVHTLQRLSMNVQNELKKELNLQEISKEFDEVKDSLTSPLKEATDSLNEFGKTLDETVSDVQKEVLKTDPVDDKNAHNR